ncbi:unnamed protein product [Lactuca virosa]|uniref:Uncharacterized protein n=1 Tax=Lactuca virosa TaxID=75947 RepID=A0AAU9M8D8_9ASTR|nr:unnamed protein product [Lactuca virosa]
MESDSASDHDEDSKKEAKFVVNPKSRKHTLQSIGTKWRNFKHYLYAKFIRKQSKDPSANLLTRKGKKAKNVRAHYKYDHRLSRKGYTGLINDIMQETSMTEEEIDRTMLWKKERELKIRGYDSDVKIIVDRILKFGKFGEVTYGTHDVLKEALGTEEQHVRVREIGKLIMPHQYFYLPKNVKHYLEVKNERVNKRINKTEDDLEKLKRGVCNVSEGASCQIWGNIEDFESEPLQQSLVGGGKVHYTNDDLDEIREEWTEFVTCFI